MMRTVSGRSDHVVVVGAGLAGLSAALHLAGRGRQVTVVERGDVPADASAGSTSTATGSTPGPTVLTMPDIIDDTFAAVGESTADRLELETVDPAYRAVFADGSSLDVHSDRDAMAAEVERFAGPQEAQGYLRLRDWLTRLYEVEFDGFIGSNFDSPLSLLTPQLARLAAIGGFRRWEPDGATLPHRRAAAARLHLPGALRRESRRSARWPCTPSSPTWTPSPGCTSPAAACGPCPTRLAAAAADAGVEFRYGATVTASGAMRSTVFTAVRTDTGERIDADAVVLTTELPDTYRLLGRTPRRLAAAAAGAVGGRRPRRLPIAGP